MSSEATCPITLTVAGDPRLARLVRMTAANVGRVHSYGCRGSIFFRLHGC